eukprot:4000066-Alexandrium_andersonii.AAC.1
MLPNKRLKLPGAAPWLAKAAFSRVGGLLLVLVWCRLMNPHVRVLHLTVHTTGGGYKMLLPTVKQPQPLNQ